VRGAAGNRCPYRDQVRERLSYVFDSFRHLGVVRAVVRDLRQQGLELPTRVTAKEAYGALIWKEPTLSTVVRILHNPAYAGAYVYGRPEYFSERRSPKTGKASAHVRNVAQWPVRIPEHHTAYVGWEEFVKNTTDATIDYPLQKGSAFPWHVLLFPAAPAPLKPKPRLSPVGAVASAVENVSAAYSDTSMRRS
jgi:hypothetical protein